MTSLAPTDEQFEVATKFGAENVSSGIDDTPELSRIRSAIVEREASSFCVVCEW